MLGGFIGNKKTISLYFRRPFIFIMVNDLMPCAVIGSAGEILAIDSYSKLFPISFTQGEWFSDIPNRKGDHEERLGISFVFQKNVIPVKPLETRLILEAMATGKIVSLEFPSIYPLVTLPDGKGGKTYMKEPWNYQIHITNVN